jgi:Uma2 family endonuclease
MVQQIETDVYYPESDGQPLGETDLHRRLLNALVFALSQWFAARDDVYVSGNIFVYYARGDRNKVVCPDVFVALGSAPRLRNTYRIWRDGPFPQVVIELASASTRAQDFGPKRDLYERLGVLDYFVFDPHFDGEADSANGSEAPTGELTCFQRATSGVPFGTPRLVPPDAVGHSDQLGLGLIVRGQLLRLVDEATGALLPTPEEEAEGRRAESAARRREAAARRREAAARRAAEERAQALAEGQRLAEERAQALAEGQRLAEERAQALADEVARLRARLDQRPEA